MKILSGGKEEGKLNFSEIVICDMLTICLGEDKIQFLNC